MSSAEEWKPGQDTQAVATARLQEQDPDKIHCPAWGVVGNMGDSICYAGVRAKAEAIQAELRRRVVGAGLRCGSSRPTSRAASPTASAMARRRCVTR